MKKRFLMIMLFIVTLCLSGCGSLKFSSNEHNYSPAWSKDENNHWHGCIDAGYTDLRKDEAPHTFETIQTIDATYDNYGFTVVQCSVCGYRAYVDYVDQLEHHYSSTYSNDENYHYFSCTDPGYEELRDGKERHSYIETTVEASHEHPGYILHECSVCHYSYKTNETNQIPYLITWVNEDGTILDTNNCYLNNIPKYHGDTPTKQGDGYIYTFTGWDKEVKAATEDTTYTAVFETKIAKAYVTYLSYNDEVLYKVTSDDLSEAFGHLSDTRTKEDDDTYSYAFRGWKEISNENNVFIFKETYEKLPIGLSISSGKVKSYSGNAQSIVIPDEYNGYSVTEISRDAFKDATSLKSITLPNNIITIDYCAFDGCSSLESIVIPENATTLAPYAFRGCASLKTIDMPSLQSIRDLFGFRNEAELADLALENVILRNSINNTNVNSLFKGAVTIKTIELKEGITSIPSNFFNNCTSLTEVILPDSITSIGEYAFNNCTSLEEIEISSLVSTIGKYAFYNCAKVKELIIPDLVTTINESTFGGCTSLESITMSPNITIIEKDAFEGCTDIFYKFDNGYYLSDQSNNYAYFIMPTNDTITSLIINDNCKVIAGSALNSCKAIESLTIPFIGRSRDTYKELVYLFNRGTSLVPSTLKTLVLSDGCTEIPVDAFDYCSSISTITIPNSVKSISSGVFDNLSLYGYSYGNGTYLGNDENNFLVLIKTNGSASSLTINENCKFINIKSSSYNTNIKTINIGLFSAELSRNEFKSLYSISTINVSSSNTFYKVKNNMLMNKDESVVYLAANKVTGSITIPNTVRIIKDYAFYDCEYTSIIIPESVEEIGYAAFSQCSYLKNLTIPSSVNIIKNEAFSYCNSLESLTLSSNAINKLNVNVLYSNEYKEVYGYLESYKAWPTNLKTINIVSLDEDSSFNIPSSNYVETINIGENIDVINEGLLRPFKQLTTINVGDNSNYKVIDGLLYNGDLTTLLCVPSNYTGSLNIIPSVTRIGDSALYSYKGSSSITLNENITEIGRYAFADTDFTSIELPEGLLNIGNNAFYYSDISSMIIPDSVQTIGQGAFAGCYSLESLVLPFVGKSLTENRNLLHLFGWYYINKELFAEFPASLKRLELSDSCTSLADDSFNYNNTLEVIVIGKGVEEIPQSLFDIESLKEINVSELNKKYASFNGILYNKDYTKMIYCPVKKEGAVTIRDEIKELDDNAFYERALITSISLPDNLEKIGINLFGACDSLTFDESDNALYIGSTLNPYLILVKGKEEATSVTINETCKFILNSAFKNCVNLKTVVLNELVDSIGDETFEDCTSLETITIPDNILTIGNNAFKNCASLKSIAIPDSVSKIGFGAFYGCESLESIRIPFIGESEEEDSNSYFGFIFGNKYRTTDSYSDNVPDSLTSLYLGNKINNIYGYSLYIRHLNNIYLSESVEMIEEYAFHSSIVTTEYEGGKYIGTIDNPYYYLSNASNVQVLNIHKDCKIINLSIRSSLEYLREINVPEENEYYTSVDGVLYSKDMTILLACPMKKSELVIPEGVEEVKGAQFNYRELRSISIPSTLKTIGWNFYSVNRPSFTITISPSNNYYTIDDKLLLNKDKTELIYNFDYSKYFEVPEAITSIKSNAFVNMPYSKTIVINNNINNIEHDVFSKWSTIILNTTIDNMSPYLKEYFNDIVDDKKGYIIELDDCVVIQMVYPV